MQCLIDRRFKNCRFTKYVFIVTTAVYSSLFTAYYDNRLENRSISSGGRGGTVQEFSGTPLFWWVCNCALCAAGYTLHSIVAANFNSYCNGSRALFAQSAQVRQESALFANVFSRCSALRSYIVPLLLIKRLCSLMMPRSKARCPRCIVFTRSRNCF
jgi:hypothetical protein